MPLCFLPADLDAVEALLVERAGHFRRRGGRGRRFVNWLDGLASRRTYRLCGHPRVIESQTN